MRQMSCWAEDHVRNIKGQRQDKIKLPVGFIQNDQLMSTLREGHLFLRKTFDAVAHNVNA